MGQIKMDYVLYEADCTLCGYIFRIRSSDVSIVNDCQSINQYVSNSIMSITCGYKNVKV